MNGLTMAVSVGPSEEISWFCPSREASVSEGWLAYYPEITFRRTIYCSFCTTEGCAELIRLVGERRNLIYLQVFIGGGMLFIPGLCRMGHFTFVREADVHGCMNAVRFRVIVKVGRDSMLSNSMLRRLS